MDPISRPTYIFQIHFGLLCNLTEENITLSPVAWRISLKTKTQQALLTVAAFTFCSAKVASASQFVGKCEEHSEPENKTHTTTQTQQD
jgi:hypothetical protein